MFILTEKRSGGVYAVKNKQDIRTVHMFEQEDDAERYRDLLIADDSPALELLEIDVDAVAINCDKFGYAYSIVTKNDLILPPTKSE